MSMGKLILPIFSLFILSLILPVSTTYADTVLLACPQIMRSDTTELVHDVPLTASQLPEMKDWLREFTSPAILYCVTQLIPYTDLVDIGYTLSINRLGINDETNYVDLSKDNVMKPFGNGRGYFRGTPYSGKGGLSTTLVDKAGSCEIVFGAGVSPTDAGRDLYVRSEPTAPMLAEYQRNSERMTKEMTEAINKLKADIAANRELAEFCAVDGIPLPTKKDEKPSLPPSLQESSTFKPPVFIGEWFSRFSQVVDGLIALPGAFADVVYEDKFHLVRDFPKLSKMGLEDFYQGNWYPNDGAPGRLPAITIGDEQKAWDLRLDTPLTERITVIEGLGQLKTPSSDQFITISNTADQPVFVTFLDSNVEPTSDKVRLRYSWGDDSGAVINVPKWTEIKFLKPVQDKKTQELKRMLKLNKGEVEIKVKNANAKNKFGVQGDFFDLFVIQTHFWVSQSTDKKLAVVGVYEGEVEVKTKDGKTIRVKPEGDRPGILVVSKELSIVRLAVVGVILAAIAGGIVWLVRKKG